MEGREAGGYDCDVMFAKSGEGATDGEVRGGGFGG